MRKRLCRSLGVTHRSWSLSFCVRTQPGSGFPKGLRSSTYWICGHLLYLVSNQGGEGMIGRTLLSLFSSTVLALTSVLILVLAGHLWDRYS